MMESWIMTIMILKEIIDSGGKSLCFCIISILKMTQTGQRFDSPKCTTKDFPQNGVYITLVACDKCLLDSSYLTKRTFCYEFCHSSCHTNRTISPMAFLPLGMTYVCTLKELS